MNFFTNVFAAVPHSSGSLLGANGGNLPVFGSVLRGVVFVFTILLEFNQKHEDRQENHEGGYPNKIEGLLCITAQETFN